MVDVLVVGAGFGRDFLHLYRLHPEVTAVGLVEPNAAVRREIADSFGVEADYADLDAALAGGRWDLVHILSPVRFHVDQTLTVLASGRSCASAVPMATTLDDIARVTEAAESGRGVYMMMETALYQREYLHALHLRDTGALGRLTYLSGAHMQDLDGFPPYWMGYPPMQYATHVIAPLLGLAEARAEAVMCLGSGELLPAHRGPSPFPVESALFRLSIPVAAQVTVSFFENARAYTEGFNVYGDRGALEWPSREEDAVVTYAAGPADGTRRGRPIDRIEVHPPDRADHLPTALRPHTRPGMYSPPGGRPAVKVHAWHGGSHPHLVHEFVSAAVENRPSAVGHARAASITAPGIVAHESALQGGRMLDIPAY